MAEEQDDKEEYEEQCQLSDADSTIIRLLRANDPESAMNEAANEGRWDLSLYIALELGISADKVRSLYAKRKGKEMSVILKTIG